MDLSHLHIGDFFSAGTFVVALGLYRKMSIIVYQHKLLWRDFEKRKSLNGTYKEDEGAI